jgi:hypothetical protein
MLLKTAIELLAVWGLQRLAVRNSIPYPHLLNLQKMVPGSVQYTFMNLLYSKRKWVRFFLMHL